MSSTSAPTKQITPWAIAQAIVEPIDSFSDALAVTYDVGSDADDVIFTLFNAGCETEPVDMSSAALEIVSSGLVGGEASYDINFFTGNFADDSAGFVTNNGSTGEVTFCIRATSYEEDLSVAFRDTEFILTYDLSNLTYEVLDLVINPEEVDEFLDTNIGAGFFIDACQCVDYACTETAVEQNSPLIVCLKAENDNADAAASVVISNFNMRITAGEGENAIEYSPVELGSTSYMPNELTVVTVGEDETVMVSTVLVAVFYSSGFSEVSVDGFVFLEFASASGARAFEEYDVVVELVGAPGLGCLAGLVAMVKGFF